MANAWKHPRGFPFRGAEICRLAILLAGLTTHRAIPAAEPAGIDLDATLRVVAHYSYGDERKGLHDLQQLVLHANSLADSDPQGFRGGLADRMAALLTSLDTTPAAKVFVCGLLADIATERQAAALSGLLTNQPLVAAAALRRSNASPARRLIGR